MQFIDETLFSHVWESQSHGVSIHTNAYDSQQTSENLFVWFVRNADRVPEHEQAKLISGHVLFVGFIVTSVAKQIAAR